MNLSRVKDVVFISMIAALSLALFVCKKDLSKKEDELSTKTQALNECVEDITNECSSVISYAILLERENSRLNRMCKKRGN